MARNRETTERKLIDAVGSVLRTEGARALGVNRVAQEAGADKVLIYRYFGGLDGLIDAWAARGEFWPTARDVLATIVPSPERLGDVIKGYLLCLLSRPLALEMLAWELAEDDHLSQACRRVREQRVAQLLDHLGVYRLPGRDPEARTAMLFAAAEHLALQARHAGRFAGISLETDQGWSRVERAIDLLAG